MSTKGWVHLMRAALRKSAEPMTLADVIEEAGEEISRTDANKVVRQRMQAGEVTQTAGENGTPEYSLNPHYVDGRGKSAGSRKSATAPKAKKSPAAKQAKAKKAPKPKKASVAKAAVPAPPEVGARAERVNPNPRVPGFMTQIGLVCEELQKAISEACDARMDHELIRDLTLAQSATNRVMWALM